MVHTCGTTGEHRAGCSKRPSSKAAAREEAKRTLRYVELLSEARTPLAVFFSILLEGELVWRRGLQREQRGASCSAQDVTVSWLPIT
jgi:hypothetical protein